MKTLRLWLEAQADDRSHTLITVALLALLIVLVFACAAVVP